MILIAANQDTVFARLAQAMDQPGLISDERYATHAARGRHLEELDELVSDWTSTLTLEELMSLMEESGVPAGLIYRAPEMMKDPHFAAREAIVRVPHPEFGELAMQNVVPKLTRTPGSVRWPGPALGEHNEEVFKEVLGMSEEQIQSLSAVGVI